MPSSTAVTNSLQAKARKNKWFSKSLEAGILDLFIKKLYLAARIKHDEKLKKSFSFIDISNILNK